MHKVITCYRCGEKVVMLNRGAPNDSAVDWDTDIEQRRCTRCGQGMTLLLAPLPKQTTATASADV